MYNPYNHDIFVLRIAVGEVRNAVRTWNYPHCLLGASISPNEMLTCNNQEGPCNKLKTELTEEDQARVECIREPQAGSIGWTVSLTKMKMIARGMHSNHRASIQRLVRRYFVSQSL